MPDALKPVLDKPLNCGVTEFMNDFRQCDPLLMWGQSFPGGDDPAVGDEPGILRYVDTDEDVKANAEILASLGRDHPWVKLCCSLGRG